MGWELGTGREMVGIGCLLQEALEQVCLLAWMTWWGGGGCDTEKGDPWILEQVRDPVPACGVGGTGSPGQSSDLSPCIERGGGRVWVQIWEACQASSWEDEGVLSDGDRVLNKA